MTEASATTAVAATAGATTADGQPAAKRTTGLSRAAKSKQVAPPEASFAVVGASKANSGFDPIGAGAGAADGGLPSLGGLPSIGGGRPGFTGLGGVFGR